MKYSRSRLFTIVVCSVCVFFACSGSKEHKNGDGDGDGDDGPSAASGGAAASGGSSGSSLDPDALAANCAGLEVGEGASCDRAELVCPAQSGALCICGGIPPETGQVQGTPTGNGNGDFGFPFGSGGRFGGASSGGDTSSSWGGDSSDGDLTWVCYAIGSPPVSGEGGEANVGGQGGAQ